MIAHTHFDKIEEISRFCAGSLSRGVHLCYVLQQDSSNSMDHTTLCPGTEADRYVWVSVRIIVYTHILEKRSLTLLLMVVYLFGVLWKMPDLKTSHQCFTNAVVQRESHIYILLCVLFNAWQLQGCPTVCTMGIRSKYVSMFHSSHIHILQPLISVFVNLEYAIDMNSLSY